MPLRLYLYRIGLGRAESVAFALAASLRVGRVTSCVVVVGNGIHRRHTAAPSSCDASSSRAAGLASRGRNYTTHARANRPGVTDPTPHRDRVDRVPTRPPRTPQPAPAPSPAPSPPDRARQARQRLGNCPTGLDMSSTVSRDSSTAVQVCTRQCPRQSLDRSPTGPDMSPTEARQLDTSQGSGLGPCARLE